MAVFVNCDKKLVFYGRCLADFYEIIEPFIIGVRLGVSFRAELKCYKRFKCKNTKTPLLRY